MISLAQERHGDVLKFFWISDVVPLEERMKEDAARYGLKASCGFLIQWNKEGGSEFIPDIPRIMYEVFGRDKLLVWDLNHEVIR
jgi:hypothetical protein